MNHLVLTPDRGDGFKGAFKPESDRYRAWYEAAGDAVLVHRIDVSRSPTERAVDAAVIVSMGPKLDRIALFCHGWETGIQFGFATDAAAGPRSPDALAAAVCAASHPTVRIALYACLAARGGRDSFAFALFDAIRRRGFDAATVFGHTDAGHTTRNADAMLFAPEHPDGEVIARGGTREYRVFNARLDDKADDLRWRAPYLSVAELRAELEGGAR